MTSLLPSSQPTSAIAADLLRLSPAYAPTPLRELSELARALGIRQVLAKDESARMLGSFKSLGGTYAGLRALARSADRMIAALLADRPSGLPALVCASDGNHGLAVAAAARLAGASARVYLHGGVPAVRARRIEAQGAEIAWVPGTYDDAVDSAAAAARDGAGILIADTTDDPDDPVVADVMAGYGVMAAEVRDQVLDAGHDLPTHVFVQAGVGGLAAAVAEGLKAWMAAPAAVVVVEPEQAASVAAGMAARRPVRVAGDLDTAAEMLSCGEASAPALAVLRRHGASVVTVSEAELAQAPERLLGAGGPPTTASGAAGLAGLLRVMGDPGLTAALGLGPDSRVLILVTEGELEAEPESLS
jgi:diaminopropionate ammonia-lyase